MAIGKIHWLGHASFRIDGDSAVVYIDPWKIARGPGADLVLVTHEHYDHCSPEDVAKVRGAKTIVVAPAPCVKALGKVAGKGTLRSLAAGEAMTEKGVRVRAVPAYNVDPSRKGFHPRDPKIPRVGYIIEVDGMIVYHTGDTDEIPEMEGLGPDVVLIPVGGTYTMGAEEAARAAGRMGAKEAVPMHWGDIVGTRADAERFAGMFKGKTHILEPE